MLSFVPTYIPKIIQALVLVITFCLVAADSMRKHPVRYYMVFIIPAILMSWANPIVALMGDSAPMFAVGWKRIIEMMPLFVPPLWATLNILTSSYTGVAFLVIVMFIGAMQPSPLVKRLMSIRSEMSIIGGIIIVGHVFRVLELTWRAFDPEFQAIWAGDGGPGGIFMLISYGIIGIPLTIIFLVLWVTSLRTVRKRMNPITWKKVQRWSYPFMALNCLQGVTIPLAHMLINYPFTSNGFVRTFTVMPTHWLSTFAGEVGSAFTFALMGIVYFIMRLNKYNADKERREMRERRRNKKVPATDAPAPDKAVEAPKSPKAQEQ